jgi:hypothetical protein
MMNKAANTVEIAYPQIDLQLFAEGEGEPAIEPTTEPETEPTTEPVTEPTQEPAKEPDITATQAFARRLKEATTKAKDELIAEMYGETHGIYTYADYQKALAEQKAAAERAKIQEEIGIDPDALKPVFQQWKESDPDFQELKAIRAEKNITKALTDLNSELKDAGIDLQLKDLSDTELSKLPNIDGILGYVQKGHSLADAFFLANKKDIISRQAQAVQQETIKKIAANGASSPGSLANGGNEILFTPEQVRAMTPAQVKANFDAIEKSMKHWK